MHAAYRVALGLDIWQLGLPGWLTVMLFDIEQGKRQPPDPDVLYDNLWDRFVERICLEMDNGTDLGKLYLNPWSLYQILQAAEQINRGDIRLPPYNARPRGVIPWSELPPPKKRKPYVRTFKRAIPEDDPD